MAFLPRRCSLFSLVRPRPPPSRLLPVFLAGQQVEAEHDAVKREIERLRAAAAIVEAARAVDAVDLQRARAAAEEAGTALRAMRVRADAAVRDKAEADVKVRGSAASDTDGMNLR